MHLIIQIAAMTGYKNSLAIYSILFIQIPAGTISKCRCWHGDPVTLDELNYGGGEGDGQGYAAYIDSCIQGLLKVIHTSINNFFRVKLQIICCTSILACVVGAQKNRLIETVLLSTHNIGFG